MNIEQLLNRIAGSIESLLENPENATLRERFNAFHTELRSSLNNAITRSNAIKMLAQHILIRPILRAISANDGFVSSNPVAIAFSNLQHDFVESGLEDEMPDLEGFYESIRMRAFNTNNTEGRQHLLLELADRFDIIHMPIEIVDFILHSTDEILQDEFGRSIGDEGVHVLDPFTGTGTFLARLIQSEIIQPDTLEWKYRVELHANEISLPAYYLTALNIEEIFHNQRDGHGGYEPFNGIILTDTFNLNARNFLSSRRWIPDNNERTENQQNLPIQVIVGGPPWSARLRRATDDNPYVAYPELEQRIRETYAEYSRAVLLRALHDPYKMAIRWASDRLDEQGIIAFVTNGSWIDSIVDSGIRACLAEEFSSIHILHMRGNARTSGERRRAEGGNVFGGGSRVPVAITILVKNPNATHEGCKIHYRDIGDSLTREQKLEALREAVSIKGFRDWETITPDRYYDWIQQRSEAFTQFYPIGSREARMGRANDTIFTLYSRGQVTGRDAYTYNFTHEACVQNAERMTQNYLDALSDLEEDPETTIDEVIYRHSQNIRFGHTLRNNLRRRRSTQFDEDYIRKVAYRPFVKTNCYTDPILIERSFQMNRVFPNNFSQNRVICISGIGSRQPFSLLMTDTIPDINFNERCQCFPRYQYLERTDTSDIQWFDEALDRIDNISDAAQYAFWTHYGTRKITKDDIFYYVYGILHAPSYQEEFAYGLSRELPRIPFAPDFLAFAEAGYVLADLHLNYENCPRHPNLRVEPLNDNLFWEERSEHFLLGTRTMRFANRERTTLIINEHVRLSGIPEEAHQYIVNGRTPLEWFISRYKITRDRSSGIINDPNGWFENPRDLITAIERIVYVSVESARIIDNLPVDIATS